MPEDMSDKLKSKLSAIFLPKSTHSAPNMSTSSSSFKPQDQAEGPGSMTTPQRVPVIFNDRDGRQRRQQTLESETARDELLRHGIKIRDFQLEADARYTAPR